MDDGAFGRRLSEERKFLLCWLRGKYKIPSHVADDFVQDAMLKAWENRHTYTEQNNFRGWLMVIMIHAYITHKRRSWRQVFSDDLELYERGGPPNQFDSLYLKQVLGKMLELPLDQLDAVVMIGRGDQYDEAADLIGVATGTMKSRLARGRRALRGLVE